MLTIIESESNAWTVIAADGELRIYNRKEPGDWSQLSLSEDDEQVDSDKQEILEELFLRDSEEDDDEDGDEPRAEEDEESDEDQDGDGDEESEEEPKQPRRRRAAARGK